MLPLLHALLHGLRPRPFGAAGKAILGTKIAPCGAIKRNMAERVGFEPTKRHRLLAFQTSALGL